MIISFRVGEVCRLRQPIGLFQGDKEVAPQGSLLVVVEATRFSGGSFAEPAIALTLLTPEGFSFPLSGPVRAMSLYLAKVASND